MPEMTNASQPAKRKYPKLGPRFTPWNKAQVKSGLSVEQRSIVANKIVARLAVDECWEWLKVPVGSYGKVVIRGVQFGVHEWSYLLFVGPLADGMQIDHLCRNTRCFNPSHLELVTPRENYLRSESPAARQSRQTHCKRGHELQGYNLIITGRHRACRACRIITTAITQPLWRAKKKAAKAKESL